MVVCAPCCVAREGGETNRQGGISTASASGALQTAEKDKGKINYNNTQG